MIFDELILHNFGVYRGEHKVALTPTVSRPIILFGALNGSGKTTLLDAMQLALYGKGAKSTSRGRLAYHDYLARSVNRYAAPSEGAGLQLAFRHRKEGHDESIRLIRTWTPSAKGLKETFEVWRDEVLDPVAADRWAEFVEDFIPIQISGLFFFDGEKIEGLADPEQSAALLKVGLHSLLGLDLVDHLVRTLGVIERRRKASQLSAPDRSAVDQLNGEISALVSAKEDLAQRAASINNEIDQCLKRLDVLERRLEASGGNLLLKRKELEAEYQRTKAERVSAGRKLADTAGGDAPLLLVSNLIEELEESVGEGAAGSIEPATHELIAKRDREILKKLTELGPKKAHIEAIKELLQGTMPRKRSEAEGWIATAITQAKFFSEVQKNEILKGVRSNLAAYDASSRALEACERNLAAIPQEDAIRGTVEAIQEARKERERLAIKAELLAEEQKKADLELERKRKQRQSRLEGLADQILSINTTQRVLRHSGRVRETLGRYREEIAKSHMLRLEELMSECFAQLHRKKSIKHRIAIDRSTYELKLNEEGGKQIAASELSAGERQLLAVSVLWALARASGRKLPTVIDTPLGRLDSTHRHYLVKNYFPKASHQVILFSTDEEVIDDYHSLMAPSVAREYNIIFDEGKRTSELIPGYFTKKALAA